MGITRSEIFSEEQNQLASMAKVLGHPARISILQHIIDSKTCICGDLVDKIGLAQATISQHLRELKNAGIIKGNIEGTSVCYCIHEENWKNLKKALTSFLDQPLCTDSECC